MLKKRTKKISKAAFLGIPYGVYLFIFVVLPLLFLLFYAYSKKGSAGELTFQPSFDNFRRVFSPLYWKVIGRSVWVGLVSTIICLLIGYPTAYFLATKRYNSFKSLIVAFIIPMWMNFLLRTLATKAMFYFANWKLGYGAIIFTMVYNFLPFMILPIYNVLIKIDNSLIEASTDLGATNLQTFFKIIVPLSTPGIVSGITMVFTPSITTYVISDMMSNKSIPLIGNLIDMNVRYHNFNVASAISLILLVFIFASMLFVRLINKKYENEGESIL